MSVLGIEAIASLVNKVVDKVFPDPTKAAELKLEVAKLAQSGELAKLAAETDIAKLQIETNKEEATSDNIFIAGWRPFIGWVCGVAFTYHFILQPLLAFIFAALNYKIELPYFDMDALFTVLMGMLGLGGLRTFEKLKK